MIASWKEKRRRRDLCAVPAILPGRTRRWSISGGKVVAGIFVRGNCVIYGQREFHLCDSEMVDSVIIGERSEREEITV